MQTTSDYGDRTIKRRKKRSFMQRVQRLGQSKSFSQNTNFQIVEYDYFVRVFKMTRSFEGSNEEKAVFANNALAETETREVDCASNQLISRVIESLLPLASNKVMERYFNVFAADLRPICNHEYASHVLQALMVIATRFCLHDYEAIEDCNHKEVCQKWLLKVSKYLLNNIEEYINEKYANPVLRTALYCLAGVPQMDKHSNKKEFEQNDLLKNVAINEPTTEHPEEFKELLEEFFTRISNWPQFKDFVYNPLQSGYLQCLLITLHHTNSKHYRKLCKKIITKCFPSDSNNTESAIYSSTALPVLEVVIQKSGAKQLKKIYNKIIAGRLENMCSVKAATFTIRKFLEKLDNFEMMTEVVSALLPEVPKILSSHNDYLLVSICEACERLKCCQSEFFQELMKSLNCNSNQDQLVTAIMSITTFPHQTPPPACSRPGSMIVQSLLRFQKPIKIVNSLLSYSPDELTKLLTSQYGSHITSAFCKSEFIGEKSRQKLINRLMGHYPELAVSKFGSRSFDDIWDVADDKSRVQITKDLASCTGKIQGSQFGKFVAAKVHLEEFHTLGVDNWKEKIQSFQKKRKLFNTIIGGEKKKKI